MVDIFVLKKKFARIVIIYSLASLVLTFSPISDDLKLPLTYSFIFLVPGYSLLKALNIAVKDSLEMIAYSSMLGLAFIPGMKAILYLITGTDILTLPLAAIFTFVLSVLSFFINLKSSERAI